MKRIHRLGFLVIACSTLLNGCAISRDPIVSISMEPSSGYSPLLVQLEAHAFNAASTPLNYEWTFGDGTSAMGSSIDREFIGNEPILIQLTVTDANGQQAVASDTLRLLNRIPHAQFTLQPNPAPTHHPLRFDASESFDPDGEIVSYHWDFGDGGKASGPFVEHAFETPSLNYRVVLTITDDSGDTNSTYRELELIGCDH